MIGCLPTQVLAFLVVFVYATQAIAFEWKPGFTYLLTSPVDRLFKHAILYNDIYYMVQVICVLVQNLLLSLNF